VYRMEAGRNRVPSPAEARAPAAFIHVILRNSVNPNGARAFSEAL
jgi:hypothetical protein